MIPQLGCVVALVPSVQLAKQRESVQKLKVASVNLEHQAKAAMLGVQGRDTGSVRQIGPKQRCSRGRVHTITVRETSVVPPGLSPFSHSTQR